ncbi:hypothetical protein CV102_00845 [Natronococcus pandeyae]|uniref:Uncharacterized protein n=1 Tax=Natronococcus pandeyae TaxID=2055836 RepID=A0A8J8TRM9_9EURY|nr:hypothetical protein [Natronococcus pandeyae]TYL40161.1 hypothetical protein CV102_00845 [Natronococcus pandeyae]
MKRRSVLAGISAGTTALVGCLDTAADAETADESGDGTDEDEDTGIDEPNDDGDTEAECAREQRNANGRAKPIETAVELQMETTSERNVDERCAKEAARAAFSRLDDRHDLDLEHADWIYPGWRYDGKRHEAPIVIQAVQNRERTGYPVCPDPEFDYDAALEDVPAEVTVSLEINDGDERHDCAHEITLRQRTMHMD